MSLRTKLIKWLSHGQINVTPPQETMRLDSSGNLGIATSPMVYRHDVVAEDQPSIALKFIKAANGHVVEVSTRAKTIHGHMDYTVETFVVPEGGKISEVVMQILVKKTLEK